MIIGTAGHIDHGKSALVKALTGMDPDRLPEEKRRGITVELGFTHLPSPSGAHLSLVDVPGHERFVKAMVAGAVGMDFILLVVAVDEGVKPQTREHLDICQLLGVREGLVVLSKADLLPALGPARKAALEASVAELVRGTFLEKAERVFCSTRSGEGMDTLRAALDQAVQAVNSRCAPEGPLFLPIDRAFSLKGVGTVVTGTLLSGSFSLSGARNDEELLSLYPGPSTPLRVREMQVHGQPVQQVRAGERVALHVVGPGTEHLERGGVLGRAHTLLTASLLNVELQALPRHEEGLVHAQRLNLHLGCAQVQATVALLDRDRLAAGESGLAQLRLSTPVATLPGQPFILRGTQRLPGRGTTVAGGRVLALDSRRRRKGSAEQLALLQADHPGGPIQWLLREAGSTALSLSELHTRSALPEALLSRELNRQSAAGEAVALAPEGPWLSAFSFAELARRGLLLLEAFHAKEPERPGLAPETLRQQLAPSLAPRVWERLLRHWTQHHQVEGDRSQIRLTGRAPAPVQTVDPRLARLVAQLEAAGLAPPDVETLSQQHKLPLKHLQALLGQACALGHTTQISRVLFYSAPALQSLQARLVGYLQEKREIDTQAFKELVGQSRKFVIPLAEYFDRERITLRVGEKRVLRRG